MSNRDVDLLGNRDGGERWRAGGLVDSLWLCVAFGVATFALVGFAEHRHDVRVWWGPRQENRVR